ncbi:hypothetical protein EHF33_07715 [Deinococcus psychrotolerans]|uniref:PsbP C-terminal domain-containing protein n=1 Tax=Deinococcus psychrotolerans TaxID=2489213 RepID=A0A3G8YCJ6_9DEIO|nr:hypothetical protein [Deinococcus psychrotolerans]AZI42650.1 hypothetical protein EHF33_07715 [Deinococcus psychrotolerans]
MKFHALLAPAFRFALTGAALLGVSAQAQTAAVQTPLVKVTDAKLPFDVSLPRGWVGLNLKDGLGGITIASQPQPPAALMRLLYIPKNGKKVDLKSEFSSFEKAVEGSGSALTFKGEKPANYGGVSGLMRQYVITSKEGTLVMRVWFGNGAKNFYSFQLTVPSQAFERVNKTFEQVLATIKF